MAHWHSANVPEHSTSRVSFTFSMCLKMVYSKGVFLHTWGYTVSNDPGTCSGNSRLCLYTLREGRVLTAKGASCRAAQYERTYQQNGSRGQSAARVGSHPRP